MLNQAVLVQREPLLALGGSDGRAPTELDDHLLAVVAGALVPHLLQGAGSLGQQHRALARRRQEGQGEMAAGQQDGRGSLPLARQRVQFTYGQTVKRENS